VLSTVDPPASNPIAFDSYTRELIISSPSDKSVYVLGGAGYKLIKITGKSSNPLYTKTISLEVEVRFSGDNHAPIIDPHPGIQVQ
jgi:hypothetical protein